MTVSKENQAIEDAARARILEQLRQDGWPEPQTEEEAMRIAIEETKLARAERAAKSST